MEDNDIEAFVKYDCFHKERRPRRKANPFHRESLFYNVEQDFFVCPMGQRMDRIGTKNSKTAGGYPVEKSRYRARRCQGCPLRGSCFKAQGNRIIEVNRRLKELKARACQKLLSPDGIKHGGKRCFEPEAVFGRMKYDMAYRRFRHFTQEKVKMDFAFFAMAFNIKKLCAKLAKMPSELLILALMRLKRGYNDFIRYLIIQKQRYSPMFAA
jgi:hypothetical protein